MNRPDLELLHDLLDGRLPPAEARALEERLESDAVLKRRYAELRLVVDGLADLAEERAPAGFADRVLGALPGAAPSPGASASDGASGGGSSPSPLRLVPAPVLAAAAAALVVGVGILLSVEAFRGGSVLAPAESALPREMARVPEERRAEDEPFPGGLLQNRRLDDADERAGQWTERTQKDEATATEEARDASSKVAPPSSSSPIEDELDDAGAVDLEVTQEKQRSRAAPAEPTDAPAGNAEGEGAETLRFASGTVRRDFGEGGAADPGPAPLGELLGRLTAAPKERSDAGPAAGGIPAAEAATLAVVHVRPRPEAPVVEPARPVTERSADEAKRAEAARQDLAEPTSPGWDALLAGVLHRRLPAGALADRLPAAEREPASALLAQTADDRLCVVEVEGDAVDRLVQNAAALGLALEGLPAVVARAEVSPPSPAGPGDGGRGAGPGAGPGARVGGTGGVKAAGGPATKEGPAAKKNVGPPAPAPKWVLVLVRPER